MKEKETKGGNKTSKENPNLDSASADEVTVSVSSYDIFEKCIKRAENLISIQKHTEEIENLSENHYSDSYRAAVVLTISALDAYIRKIIVSEIRKAISDTTKPLNNDLSDYIKKLLNQDKLLEAARNYNILEKIEEAVKIDFETKSFQGEWKITQHLKMVGYKDIFSQVSVEADINEKNLIRKLNLFTNRRHIIAHSGDYDLNQTPHKENKIDKKYAQDCVDTVRLFAKTINKIIEGK
jgi:DNA polymerase III delta prime subunit